MGQSSLYWLNISETPQMQKKETSFADKGVAWRTETSEAKISDGGLPNQIRSITVD